MNTKDLEFFDKIAHNWDDMVDINPDKINHILDILNPQPSANVLDVGSGTGVLIPFIETRIGKEGAICAADISGEMLKVSQAKNGHLGNVTFKQMDIENDTLPDKFDNIILYCVYPHLTEAEQTIEWLVKVNLKPNGTLVIAFPESKEGINGIHHHNDGSVHSTRLPTVDILKQNFIARNLTVDYTEDNEDFYILRISQLQ